MSRQLGPLPVESSQPESAKFTAPIIFVPGLWDDLQSWRRFTGFLSHRGWRCVAAGWPDGDARVSLAGRERLLREALRGVDERPIVVGHDVGGSIALRVADCARAVVALAPVAPGAAPFLATESGTWWQRLRGGDRSPARSLAAAYPRAAGRTESTQLLSELASAPSADMAAADGAPLLVVAGAGDPVVPSAIARSLAQTAGAAFDVVPGGHAIHLDDGWEATAGLVHRWIIRSLGENLLAFYEEAWADRDPA